MIKFKIICTIFFVSLVFSQNYPDYGPGEQWDIISSTQQGFIIFDNVTLNGESIVGGEMDGQVEICPDQNCDMIGVMFNNISVGWSYCSVINDGITLAVNFNDSQTPGVENYPSHAAGFAESTVNFHFYDASEQKVYYNIFASSAEPFGLVEAGDLNITGDGTSQSGITIQGNWQGYELGDPVCPLAYASNFTAVGGSGDENLCDISYFTCGDENACNYNDILNTCSNGGDCSSTDDCELPLENFDCLGNCLEEYDCNGLCGGNSILDMCGTCDDDIENDCILDCNNEWGGDALEDMCGTCDYDQSNDCIQDCNNEWGGDAILDNCGICDNDIENDCVVDCAGTFGGDALVDMCGACDNDISNDCIQDCNNEWGGDAILDNCGACDNNALNDCVQDCNEDWGGSALEDMCGTCDNDASNDCILDCNNEWGGDAILDNCGACDNNALNDCVQDCNEDWGGDAYLDCNNFCSTEVEFIGGNENLDTFGIDCFGVCGGSAYIDLCGECVGGNTELVECSCEDWEKDCNDNCPGSIYLGNISQFQYNDNGDLLDTLLTENDPGNFSISSSTLEVLYGEFWSDSLENINLELGYDCNNECGGNYIIDCSEECLPVGENEWVESYLDENGYIVESGVGEQGFCCEEGNIDCSNVCFGNFVEDLNEDCCAPGFIGCDGECGDIDNPPTAVDVCGICDGDNSYDEFGDFVGPDVDCTGTCNGDAAIDACGVCNGANYELSDGYITGPDADCLGVCYGNTMIDCAGECNGDAIVETFYLDNDLDGLGSMESMNFCSVNVPENWVLNSDDIDDNCFSNMLDCTGECDGDAILDCLSNCSNSDLFIGNLGALNEYGFDCNNVCEGEAEIDLCGICAGGDTNIEYCSCDDWEKDCAGNCPGFTYLGNLADLQYNSNGELLDDLLTENETGNFSISISTLENIYGEFWLDLINTDDIDIGVGYDCSGNCQGVAYTDCQNTCSNLSEFIGNQGYLNEFGFDCLEDCNGVAYQDICGNCYEDGFDFNEINNIGLCYNNGESTGELCTFEDSINLCSEGYCFIEGDDADECGVCYGSNQCVYNVSVTTDDIYPNININWNEIDSEETVTYYIYRNNELTFETQNNWINDNALEFNTEYCYKIAAEIGNEYIQFISEYEECGTTTNDIPHYIFSFPEVINTPPNMPLNIPVRLEGLQEIPIFEMNILVNFNPAVFTPSSIEGVNSFANENYNLEVESIGESFIQLYLSSNSDNGLVIENEEVLIISGVSGNGNTEAGIIGLTANISNLLGTPFSLLFYDGIIQISEFYVSLLGAIEYYSNGQKTSNVDLSLEGYTSLNQYYEDETVTDNNGGFSFYSILPGSYDVIPSKNNILDIGNELSSTDASQIARHSIGLFDFTNYQQLAADVTLNGNVSGLDASKVARYRIGQIDALNEYGVHWVFYPEVLDVEELIVNAINAGNSLITADCTYDPNTLNNTCNEGPYRNLPCNEEMVNSPECPLFVSIRLGDVTGNWLPNPVLAMSESITDPIELFIENEEFTLPIIITDIDEMQGIDISIQYDNELFQLENITYLENELSNMGYNLMYNELNGEINISSFATMQLTQIEEFININFSLIETEFTQGEIEITNFLFNELETESGFEIHDDSGLLVLTDHVIINTSNLANTEIHLPNTFNLYQNYPNPFNPITEISFDLPQTAIVSIGIYDVTGNLIIELIDNKKYSPGNYKFKWDASNNPGGIYFCRMKADKYIETYKMILLK